MLVDAHHFRQSIKRVRSDAFTDATCDFIRRQSTIENPFFVEEPFCLPAVQRPAALRESKMKIVRPDAKSAWELYDLVAIAIESKNLASTRPYDHEVKP